MGWIITDDLDGYDAAAGNFLRSDPALHTTLLTVVDSLRHRGTAAFGTDAPVFGWCRADDGAVGGVFLQTPPYPLLLTRTVPEAIGELVEALVATGRAVPGVNADRRTAESFAAAWRLRTGSGFRVEQQLRLYRLGELTPQVPAPPGRARVAGPDDRDTILAWFKEFLRETGGVATGASGVVDDRLGHGGFTLWEVDGVPVSLAGVTRIVSGMARIAPVYTPPGRRGCGYGGAVTAAASAAVRRAGAAEILLFTDLENPTSNALYQRLGYTEVEDRLVLVFTS